MENNNLFSHHIFLFPFQWEFVGKMMKNNNMEERTNLKEFVGLFDKDKWKRKEYKIDTVLNYNEYNYFYSMVRDVLFDAGTDPDKSIIANLFYNIEPDQHFYEFKVFIDAGKSEFKTYKLHIESIILHLYSTGVGVLSFHLNNRFENQKEPDDILRINQAGRRIYPPFFAMDFDLIGTQSQYEYNNFEKGLNIVKTKELAAEFSVINELDVEDFSKYHESGNFANNPFQLPGFFSFLFKGIPLTVERTDFKSDAKKVFINPLLDDRMYVISWYGNDKLSMKISELVKDRKNLPSDFYDEDFDWWYKYIFNDQKDKTCQDDYMKGELIQKHTYWRWSGYSTFYGINRYSFVCITSSLENLKRNNAAFLVNHMQTIYYKMAELCLVQRACILRFSEEVARISAMNENKKNSLTARVSNLYKQYIRFVNRVYFREITAQEQGIELYSMLQEHMKIEQNVKDLDNEISELHQYAILREDQERNKNLTLLSILGAVFIIPTFISGFYGMNLFPAEDIKEYKILIWVMFGIGIVCTPASFIWFLSTFRKKPNYLILLLSLLILFTTLISPIILKL